MFRARNVKCIYIHISITAQPFPLVVAAREIRVHETRFVPESDVPAASTGYLCYFFPSFRFCKTSWIIKYIVTSIFGLYRRVNKLSRTDFSKSLLTHCIVCWHSDTINCILNSKWNLKKIQSEIGGRYVFGLRTPIAHWIGKIILDSTKVLNFEVFSISSNFNERQKSPRNFHFNILLYLCEI